MVRIAHRRNVFFSDGEWWDTATNLLSCLAARRFGFSHTELVFSDGVAFTSLFSIKEGQCLLPGYSKPKGGLAMFHRRGGYPSFSWRFTPLNLTREQEASLRMSCEHLTRESMEFNETYDLGGVVKFVLPWAKENPNGYFCTEAVYNRVQDALHCFPECEGFRVSPNLMVRFCEERFGPLQAA